MTDADEGIRSKAIQYARQNKTDIAKRHTDPQVYLPDQNPVSVFMAGSPGAGKTEASKALLDELENMEAGRKALRIDPDELRTEFKDYSGNNSALFQPAVSILVEKIHDFALKQRQSFILDGTLSNYDVAEKNIQRSLKKNRQILIVYVYLNPEQAWRFVQAREKIEGRNIPPERFIDQYFAARENVNRLKDEFGKEIRVDLVLKNIDGPRKLYKSGIDKIDHHIPENYTRADIEKFIRMQ